jgi:hypothetical protein
VDAAALQRDGHLLVRGAVGESVLRRARTAAASVTDRLYPASALSGTKDRPLDYLTGSLLWQTNDGFRDLVFSPRLAALAAGALGCESVRLLYDQIFVKPPAAALTMWHQDQVYWPIDTTGVADRGPIDSVRIWLSLTDLPAAVGGLHFANQSHRHGPIEADELQCGAPGHCSTISIAGQPHTVSSYGALAAGDVTIHAGYALHAAGKNPTSLTRYGVSLAYIPDGTRVAQDLSDQDRSFLAAYAPGRGAGDLFDSTHNPLLWPSKDQL